MNASRLLNLFSSLAMSVVVSVGLNGTNALFAREANGDGSKLQTGDKRKKTKMNDSHSVYDFKAKSLEGKEIDLASYKGDVLLIVNTASQCGFTKQYEGLEKLHEQYKDRGLRILGFPCNQFGGQEPGDSSEIASFCQKNYGVNFQMFDKIDVNGDKAHPLYRYLTNAAPGALGTKAIKWNFTKFLIDRKGNVLKRYAPQTKPEELIPEVEKLL